MPADSPKPEDPAIEVRRCSVADWPAVRRMHVKMALGLPLVVDVELNDVLATPDAFWQDFVHTCTTASDQALFLAEAAGSCVGMGHVRLQDGEARLSMLYVDEPSRRRGVGTALVRAQEAWAGATGATSLVCHIPSTSVAGLVVERLGWHQTAEVFHTQHGLLEHKWVR